MSSRIDINCDMGESLGRYVIGNDEEAVRAVTSANLACGFHAADPTVMARTVDLCKRHGVMVGAHPGYPDLPGFGRRFMDLSREDLINGVIYQVGALKGFLDRAGSSLQHVKLHGALYNHLAREEELFLAMAEAVKSAFGDVIFFTLSSKRAAAMKRACAPSGMRIALEAFPDRNYTDEGELLPRTRGDAVIRDPRLIAERALTMMGRRGIESVTGQWIPMEIDTICIHGDNRESVEAAHLIRERAAISGIDVMPAGAFM